MKRPQADYRFIEQMHDLHYESLLRYVMGFVGDLEAARDIVNDAFLNMWHYREKIDPNGPVRAYLFRVSKNKSLNYLKHRSVELKNRESIALYMVTDNQPEEEPAEEYDAYIERLRAVLEHLPESQREVITRICIDGQLQKEVARTMNISINTVKTHLLRGMKNLRAEMMKIYTFFI